jgi:hypothetical protein
LSGGRRRGHGVIDRTGDNHEARTDNEPRVVVAGLGGDPTGDEREDNGDQEAGWVSAQRKCGTY